jgi:ethanolamine ammonia-lyase large subunit
VFYSCKRAIGRPGTYSTVLLPNRWRKQPNKSSRELQLFRKPWNLVFYSCKRAIGRPGTYSTVLLPNRWRKQPNKALWSFSSSEIHGNLVFFPPAKRRSEDLELIQLSSRKEKNNPPKLLCGALQKSMGI